MSACLEEGFPVCVSVCVSVMNRLKVMKHYFMFVYMVYSLKMVSTKDHRGL